jgi:hypothetical protein
MDASVFAPGERAFLEALNDLGIRYVLVGMSAALLQGVNAATLDMDLWFEDLGDARIREAARRAGGFYVGGHFGMQPPALGGEALGERFDVVTHLDGLGSFAEEWANTREMTVDGVRLRVLLLPRIAASKRASRRPKDLAQLPAIEEALAALDEASASKR